MICSKCSTSNAEGIKFCGNCGSPLYSPVSPLVTNAGDGITVDQNPYQPQKSGKGSMAAVLTIVLLLILAGAAGAFFLVNPNSGEGNLFDKALSLFNKSKESPSSLQSSFKTSPFSQAINNLSNQTKVGQENTPPTSLAKSKWDIDSNDDLIPDFVETAIGYDPTKDSCQWEAGCGADFSKSTSGQKNILVILDSSGSMAEKIADGVKMDVARQSLSRFIEGITNDVNVGLMVYGHKGSNSVSDKTLSCQGIELLYPLGSLNKTQFIQAVNSFKPTGWTPIGDSLRRAKTEAFVGKDGQKNSILLITDGIETCNSNPLGAVNELKQSGINATVDVIGLAVDNTSAIQLKQIADASGGKYVTANNSAELNKAIDNSLENLKELAAADDCLVKNWGKYHTCLYNKFLKAQDYLNNLYLEEKCFGSKDLGCKKNDTLRNMLWKNGPSGAAQSWEQWKSQRDQLKAQYQQSGQSSPN